jgi:4-amino-4-deoxy-L-arabinose transferase-like glycosyltransferase
VTGKDGAGVRRFRLLAAAIAAGGLGARLAFSLTSFGTNDVTYFRWFARTVRAIGPVSIYHVHFNPPYNHPPLVGWMLAFVNWMTDRGLSFPFALRLFPIIADLGATLLVIRIVRPRKGDRSALLAGALVAFSPVLILVSGVHGNFDTVFCALLLLSLFLMVDKQWPVWAGVVGAIAVGVKLVPIVAIPVVALSLGRRRATLRYAAAFTIASTAIWVPALAREPHGIIKHVLGYRGQYAHWGFAELATLAGVSRHALHSVQGIMAWCASGFAIVAGVWYLSRTRYRSPYAGAALSLTILLFLLPAWGSQYMSWPTALVFFIGTGLGASYSLAAGSFLLVIYAKWSVGFPLDHIHVTLHESMLGRSLGLLAWSVLGVMAVYALVRARRIGKAEIPA